MKIRVFMPSDADFCFRVRSSAFIQKFYNEIGSEAVTAGVNAFMPSDYILMAEEVISMLGKHLLLKEEHRQEEK